MVSRPTPACLVLGTAVPSCLGMRERMWSMAGWTGLDWRRGLSTAHTLLALLFVQGLDRCKALALTGMETPRYLVIRYSDDILVVNHIWVSAHFATLPT
ncbi:hypothetical protein B0T13DRAFT_128627 [Neurospora crassa]|nr:hypothetical protein B0T13DRAFT_128627 [Neurospora crassa]